MKAITLALVALLASPVLASPGDVIEPFNDKLFERFAGCGLTIVDGDDPRLSNQIRARNVDYVVLRGNSPGLLVDRTSRAGADFSMVYLRTNGSFLLSLARDFDFNDLTVDTVRQGRIAFSRSYRRASRIETDYVLQRGHGVEHVSDVAFYGYLEDVNSEFVRFVCDSN